MRKLTDASAICVSVVFFHMTPGCHRFSSATILPFCNPPYVTKASFSNLPSPVTSSTPRTSYPEENHAFHRAHHLSSDADTKDKSYLHSQGPRSDRNAMAPRAAKNRAGHYYGQGERGERAYGAPPVRGHANSPIMCEHRVAQVTPLMTGQGSHQSTNHDHV